MGLRINTNVQSLTAQHRLEVNKGALEHSQAKISSGSRIVKTMDDAAGLALSETIRATFRATQQNVINAQNGFFQLQTADSALNEITNIIVRMKELSTASASDTNGDKERAHLDAEFQALKAEMNRISAATVFNGRPLLNGGGDVDIQVGPSNNSDVDRIRITNNFVVTSDGLGIDGMHVRSNEAARDALDPLVEALDQVAVVRGVIGAGESRLNSTVKHLTQYDENLEASFSQIRDADLAKETADATKFGILSQAGISILAQANASPRMALKLLE
ncbi:MAG: flagellin FliC [Deltaproteobacteria bacterium]|nr:flagellin FliC [Deltaproteobacteria bacterium]MBI3294104.1 flagellin FliC [Deltaproteobacteria bacterium]